MMNKVLQKTFSLINNINSVCANYLKICRSTGDDDVVIKILYCGICHSDLHSIKNEWKNATYPLVPG